MQAKERLARIGSINTTKLLLESQKREIILWDSMISKAKKLNSFDSLVDKLTEFRDSLVKDAESLTSETRFMIDLVKGLEDVRLQKIIVSRYFQGKSFPQVASDIDYSLKHTYILHKAALEQINLLLNENIS